MEYCHSLILTHVNRKHKTTLLGVNLTQGKRLKDIIVIVTEPMFLLNLNKFPSCQKDFK